MSASLPAADPARESTPVGGDAFELHRRGDVLVVRPLGSLDRTSLPRIRHAILGAGRPVVLDLDGCVLVRPSDLLAEDFDPGARAVPVLRIACGRLSCRRLLARVGAPERYGVYESVDDALHSLASPVLAGAEVTVDADGRAVASLEVRGHLCAATAPLLHAEIARLVADGIQEISAHLGPLDACARHGRAAPRLDASDAASPSSAAAAEVVERVFQVVGGAPPSTAHRIAVGPTPAAAAYPPASGRVTGRA